MSAEAGLDKHTPAPRIAGSASGGTAREPRSYPAGRFLRGLLRDPLAALEEVSRSSGGEITRLNLGPFRPYLVTRPEHLQYVLRDNAPNYRREGLMWKPLSRLVGEPSGADPEWPVKRRVFQSLLTGKSIETFTDEMAATIARAVDELSERVPPGTPVDAMDALTRVVYRAILRIFIGDKLSLADADRLGEAIMVATTSSFRARMLLPFVPLRVPLPGDRAFHRAVQTVDDIVYPVVRKARRMHDQGEHDPTRDVVSLLLAARDENGAALDDKGIRDGVVSLFVAGTETTVTALSWLWVVLAARPDVAARLQDEIDTVVGTDQPTRAHLPRLRYTKMVLQELLRMYSVGWIIPRVIADDDVIDGVKMHRGAPMIVSPYLTHRVEDVWPDPYVFAPERFAPGRSRHRFAYLAFGAGPHQCVGSVFFTVEAQLIVATMMSRLRPKLHGSPAIEPQAGLTLKPRRPIEITFRPVEGR
ncbi:cytochrome P450 [Actinomadura sp. NPDC047616]|uniref:cytochrome P450 n=1 Tax=Actinomadura sp. NPDC047616 TaxID=3155914 RepID=UPI00340A1B17